MTKSQRIIAAAERTPGSDRSVEVGLPHPGSTSLTPTTMQELAVWSGIPRADLEDLEKKLPMLDVPFLVDLVVVSDRNGLDAEAQLPFRTIASVNAALDVLDSPYRLEDAPEAGDRQKTSISRSSGRLPGTTTLMAPGPGASDSDADKAGGGAPAATGLAVAPRPATPMLAPDSRNRSDHTGRAIELVDELAAIRLAHEKEGLGRAPSLARLLTLFRYTEDLETVHLLTMEPRLRGKSATDCLAMWEACGRDSGRNFVDFLDRLDEERAGRPSRLLHVAFEDVAISAHEIVDRIKAQIGVIRPVTIKAWRGKERAGLSVQTGADGAKEELISGAVSSRAAPSMHRPTAAQQTPDTLRVERPVPRIDYRVFHAHPQMVARYLLTGTASVRHFRVLTDTVTDAVSKGRSDLFEPLLTPLTRSLKRLESCDREGATVCSRLLHIVTLSWPSGRSLSRESAQFSIWTAILRKTTREFARLGREAAAARRLPEENSDARLCRRTIVQLAGLLGHLPESTVGTLLRTSEATMSHLPTLLLFGKNTTVLRIVHGLDPHHTANVYLSAAPFIAAEDLLFHAGRDRLLVRRVLETATLLNPSRSKRIGSLVAWLDSLERGGTIIPRYGYPRHPVDNPYALLGVTVNAGENEIVKNYRLLSRELHEDRNPEDPVRAALLFSRVTEAYNVLREPEGRAAFNGIRPTDAHYYPPRNVFGVVPAVPPAS